MGSIGAQTIPEHKHEEDWSSNGESDGTREAALEEGGVLYCGEMQLDVIGQQYVSFLQGNQGKLREAVSALRRRERRIERDAAAERSALEEAIQELEAEKEFYMESLRGNE